MMRVPLALLAVCSAIAASQAAPPVVTVPAEVHGDVGAFVAVRAEVTEATVVKFVPLDGGLNVFPADLLSDKTATVVTSAKGGRFKLLCYSGNADGPSEPVTVTVVIGTPKPDTPDPVEPEPTPVTKAENVAVVIVEESRERTPGQAAVINSAEFEQFITAGGHVRFVVDKDDAAAKRNGYLIYAKEFPTALVFDQTKGGKPLAVFPLPDSGSELVNKVKGVVK